jgi:hypothetical protein
MTGCSRFRLLVGLALIRSMIIDNNTLLDVNRGDGSLKVHGLLRVSMPIACGFCRSYQAAFQILVWRRLLWRANPPFARALPRGPCRMEAENWARGTLKRCETSRIQTSVGRGTLAILKFSEGRFNASFTSGRHLNDSNIR